MSKPMYSKLPIPLVITENKDMTDKDVKLWTDTAIIHGFVFSEYVTTSNVRAVNVRVDTRAKDQCGVT